MPQCSNLNSTHFSAEMPAEFSPAADGKSHWDWGRIFYFQNAGNAELYCSSADWMSRNLDRRIELMFPILEKAAFEEVKKILDSYFKDNTNAMELTQNGSWLPVQKDKKDESYQTQFELYKYYKKLDDSKPQTTEKQFEVRRK